MTSFANRLLLASCLAVFGVACGDDAPSSEDDHGHDHDSSAEHAHDAAAESDSGDDLEDDEVPCNADYPSFTAGMSVKVGELTVKLQSVTPAPPRQKTKNDWVIQVLDASGQPLDGLKFTNASSYMPVHRHGGKTQPQSTPNGTPGTYGLSNIDFIMRGPWQVLFDLDQAGTNRGTATIQICVE